MDSGLEPAEEYEYNELIQRFEQSTSDGKTAYFDVEEFEDIIDYYDAHHNFDRVDMAIRIASEIHPQNSLFKLKLAQRLTSTNRFPRALTLLKQLIEIEPNNSSVLQQLAHTYSKMGLHQKAIDVFEKNIRMGGDEKEMLVNIAYEFEHLNRYEDALKYFRKVLELDPDDEELLYEVLFCFEINNSYDKSIDFFKEYTDERPYSKIAWFNLGISYASIGLYEKALDAYEFTLAIDDEFSSAYFNKANALINLQRYEEAIEMFEETLEHETPDAITFLYIGQCHEHLGHTAEAAKFYLKAIETDEYLEEAWINLASLFMDLEEYEKALPFAQEAVSINDSNLLSLNLLADIKLNLGKHEEAIQDYLVVYEKNPDYENIAIDLIDAYLYDAQYDKALEVAEKEIKDHNEDYLYHYKMFVTLYLNKKIKASYAYLQSALEYDFGETMTEMYDEELIALHADANIQQVIDAVEQKLREGNKN